MVATPVRAPNALPRFEGGSEGADEAPPSGLSQLRVAFREPLLEDWIPTWP